MRRHCHKRATFGSFLLWLCMLVHAAAQNTSGPETFVNIGNTCESNIARLDNIDHQAGKEGLLIAIARLGDGEHSRTLNRRRLHNIRLYLREIRQRATKTIILAEGEEVHGRGRVEVYVGGKLVDVLGVGRGEDLYAGSCDGTSDLDKYFYDSRRRKSR